MRLFERIPGMTGAGRTNGRTALMMASFGGHVSCVKFLLAKGAAPNQGSTPPFCFDFPDFPSSLSPIPTCTENAHTLLRCFFFIEHEFNRIGHTCHFVCAFP